MLFYEPAATQASIAASIYEYCTSEYLTDGSFCASIVVAFASRFTVSAL